MTESNHQLTLAIEAAINGGSLALFRGNQLVDDVTGATGVSRAEDLLPNIYALLSKNGLQVTDISQVLAGAGPGSFTGIRIGLATAMGLATALKAEFRSVSTLDAIACGAERRGAITCALPVGRDTVCMQSFADGLQSASVAEPVPTSEFYKLVLSSAEINYVINGSLAASLFPGSQPNIVNIGNGLAVYIGRFAEQLADSPPLFIGKQK